MIRQMNLSRERLHELVWSAPMTELSRKYYISGRGLRLACDRMRVPVPPKGHWAKKSRNRAGPQQALLDSRCCQQQICLMPRPKKRTGISREGDFLIRKISAIPASLLKSSKKILAVASQTVGRDGFIDCSLYGGLSISVSPRNAVKALRLLGALIAALESKGHQVRVENGATYILIRSAKIKISLKEIRSQVMATDGSQRKLFLPTDRFAFRVHKSGMPPKEWREHRQKISERLWMFIQRLDEMAR